MLILALLYFPLLFLLVLIQEKNVETMEGKYTPLTLSNGRDTLIRHMLKIFK